MHVATVCASYIKVLTHMLLCFKLKLNSSHVYMKGRIGSRETFHSVPYVAMSEFPIFYTGFFSTIP